MFSFLKHNILFRIQKMINFGHAQFDNLLNIDTASFLMCVHYHSTSNPQLIPFCVAGTPFLIQFAAGASFNQ